MTDPLPTDPPAGGDVPGRPAGIEVVLVSGLSGAGRSTAAKVLEDLGWFVVDNLPPELISTMVELGARSRGEVARIAVVMRRLLWDRLTFEDATIPVGRRSSVTVTAAGPRRSPSTPGCSTSRPACATASPAVPARGWR